MIRTIVSGSGGQGVLFLGKLIASTAMQSGLNVTWFPSYGAEMRGGTANCTIIISNEMIGSPITGEIDVLIALNEASRTRFQDRLRQSGLMITDSSMVKSPNKRSDIHALSVPASEMAFKLGEPKSANMFIFGAFVNSTKFTDDASIQKALEQLGSRRGPKTLELNIEAIKRGIAFCEDKKGKDS